MSKSNSDGTVHPLSEPCVDGPAREEAVAKLRSAAELFYDQASLEQVLEMELFVWSLLARRGLLREQGSTRLP